MVKAVAACETMTACLPGRFLAKLGYSKKRGAVVERRQIKRTQGEFKKEGSAGKKSVQRDRASHAQKKAGKS